MKKVIIVLAVVASMAIGLIGCTTISPVNNSRLDCVSSVVNTDTNRNEDGELFYGTNDYPEGRRADMQAQYIALMNGEG